MARGRTLRQDIGGQFLGDPRGFLLFVPLWWLLSLPVVSEFSNPRIFAVSMVGNLVAFVVVFGVLLLLRQTWFHHRSARTVPLAQVIAAGATLGAIKSGVTISIIAWGGVDLGGWELVGGRVASSALTGTWILILSSLMVSASARYKAERDILIAELLQDQRLNKPSPTHLRVDDAGGARVHAVIKKAKAILSHATLPPEQMSEKLQHLIDKQIRPLSHELWVGQARKITDFSLRDLTRALLGNRRYWIVPTTIALTVVNALILIPPFGLFEGLWRTALVAGLCAVVLTLVKTGPPLPTTAGLILLLIGAFAFSAANEALALGIFGATTLWPVGVSGGLNAILFLINAVVHGIAKVALDDHKQIRRELQAVAKTGAESVRLDSERLRLRHREMAEILHGSVQNRLLALTLTLGAHADTGQRQSVLTELELIEKDLLGTKNHVEDRAGNPTDIELAALASRWKGIVHVVVTCVPDTVMDNDTVTTVSKLAEEGVSNAVRHGLAETVDIRLEENANTLTLTISDDGLGPRGGRPGLGSLQLTQQAGSRWSLDVSPLGVGSVLKVHLPRTPGKQSTKPMHSAKQGTPSFETKPKDTS